ncbi:MAG: amidohydrolase family protein [Candidatus Bipolaricaulia bacterium]
MRILLTGGTVLTCDGEGRVYSAGSIAIEGTRIVSIGEGSPGVFPADLTIDCSKCFITPGLVNCHVHLGEQLLKGVLEDADFQGLFYTALFRWESELTPDLVRRASLAAAVDSLRCGVTTVADMYHHAEATAQAVEEVGIRALLGQKVLGFSLAAPPQSVGEGASYRFDRGSFREQLAAACEFADRRNGTAQGRITTSLSPHATNTLEPWMLEEVAEAADVRSARVHMHLAQMESEREEVRARYGMGCGELLDKVGLLGPQLLAAHSIFLSESEIALLAARRSAVAHNPVANAKDGGLVAPVERFVEHNVTVGLGTDAFHMSVLETARFACYLHRVLHGDASFPSAPQVLAWATREAARAVGLEGSIGSLEVGKCADLVVWDMGPLSATPCRDPSATLLYHAGPANVSMVMVNGQQVLVEREVQTVDAAQVEVDFALAAQEMRRRIRATGGVR